MKLKTEETICAQSTPQGIGAISLIRVSGTKALLVARKVCPFLPKQPLSHRIYYGWMALDHSKTKLDEVLVSYFAKGKSFTGEESLEISCHGNPNIVKEILEALVLKGARLAERGEFTYRAFMNGRLDLVQAEGLLGLIHSQSRRAKEVYLDQLTGGFSKQIRQLIETLQGVHAHVEADIDFSEENLEIDSMEKLLEKGTLVLSKISQFLESFHNSGQWLREGGIKVFLIGPPNVGKSSLFNALLEKEQAIVTKHPGTTRDLLEGRLYVGEMGGFLMDTAGLREAKEEVEKIGVHKVEEAILKKEGIFLFVLDLSRPILKEDLLVFKTFKSYLNTENTFILGNKLDLLNRHGGVQKDFAQKNFVQEDFSRFNELNRKKLKSNFSDLHFKKRTSEDFLSFQFHQTLAELFSLEEKSKPIREGEKKGIQFKKSIGAYEKEGQEIYEKNQVRDMKGKTLNSVDHQKVKGQKKNRCPTWPKKNFFTLSAEKHQSLLKLKKFLKKTFKEKTETMLNPVTEVRHYELLLDSKTHLKKALKLMKEKEGLDLIAFELKESLLPLYEIVGEEWNEQVVDKIFKEFCLGK